MKKVTVTKSDCHFSFSVVISSALRLRRYFPFSCNAMAKSRHTWPNSRKACACMPLTGTNMILDITPTTTLTTATAITACTIPFITDTSSFCYGD